MSLAAQVLTPFIMGLITDVVLAPAEKVSPPSSWTWVEPAGALRVNAICMMIIPLLVSLFLGSTASSEAGVLARAGGKAAA